jgi:hypothetical protein
MPRVKKNGANAAQETLGAKAAGEKLLLQRTL